MKEKDKMEFMSITTEVLNIFQRFGKINSDVNNLVNSITSGDDAPWDGMLNSLLSTTRNMSQSTAQQIEALMTLLTACANRLKELDNTRK